MPLDRDFHTLDEIREAVREAREAREESQADAAKALEASIATVTASSSRGEMPPPLWIAVNASAAMSAKVLVTWNGRMRMRAVEMSWATSPGSPSGRAGASGRQSRFLPAWRGRRPIMICRKF